MFPRFSFPYFFSSALQHDGPMVQLYKIDTPLIFKRKKQVKENYSITFKELLRDMIRAGIPEKASHEDFRT